MSLNKQIQSIIINSLKEDSCQNDITTLCAISPKLKGKGIIVAQEKGVLAGIEIARTVFKLINKKITFKALKKDGSNFKKGDNIATISGNLQTIISGERVALNFLSLLSGISTVTRKFVEKTKGLKVQIKDTRKTIPNLRILEKYAVKAGGGYNHRSSLSDGIIVKDNHLKAAGYIYNGHLNKKRFSTLIDSLRKKSSLKIEVEVESVAELKEVLKYKPNIIMLDNFSVVSLKKAVCFRNKHYPKIKLEASGGVNLKNVGAVASSGVDHVSIGMITDSPGVIDFSLDISD